MPEVAEPEAQTQEPAIWDLPEIMSLSRGETPAEAPKEPVKPAVEPVVTSEVKIDDVAKEAPKDPVVDTSTWTPKARENFARVEEARKRDREEFQAQLLKKDQERQAEIEAREAKLRQEYEERISKQSTLTPEEITKRDQEIEKLRGELKYVALERDPDFLNRFVTPKTQLLNSLKEMTAGSVTPEDFDRAFRRGDQEKLDEFRDSLQPHQQRRWDATLLNMEQLDIQKDLALQNRDQTYEQILQERHQRQQESIKDRFNQNLQAAREVAMEPFEKVPELKDNPELMKKVQSTLTAIAGGEVAEEWDSRKIMRQVAASVVQTEILMAQHKGLQEKDEALAQQKKKIEELETFIQSKYGSLPNTEVSTEAKAEVDNRPIWEQFQQPSSNGSGVPKGREFI